MWSENTNYVMALLVYTLWLPSIISCHIFLSPVSFITLKPGSSALDQFPSLAILPTETANMRPRRTPAWTLPTPTAPTGVSNHFQLQNVWLNFEFFLHQEEKCLFFFLKNKAKIVNNCRFSHSSNASDCWCSVAKLLARGPSTYSPGHWLKKLPNHRHKMDNLTRKIYTLYLFYDSLSFLPHICYSFIPHSPIRSNRIRSFK